MINPYSSPQTAGTASRWSLGQFRPRLVELLVVIGIIGMLVALLLPARRGAGTAARASMCRSNLKQIAMALQRYADEHGALPPAYTVDADGKPLHSWRTLILPYMEHTSLFEKIDLSKPWDDPANKAAFETSLHTYRCPAVGGVPETHTTYFAVVVPGGCFRPTEPTKFSEITDDHNLTLMVIEADGEQAVHWMSPADGSERWLTNCGSVPVLPHDHAVSVSGHVQAIGPDTKQAQLRALISIAGNDDAIARGAD